VLKADELVIFYGLRFIPFGDVPGVVALNIPQVSGGGAGITAKIDGEISHEVFERAEPRAGFCQRFGEPGIAPDELVQLGRIVVCRWLVGVCVHNWFYLSFLFSVYVLFAVKSERMNLVGADGDTS
jgi:hypothetical protein